MNKSYSSTILIFCGIILMGLGLYFVFLRPPLLPEDPRYMGTSFVEIQAATPGLFPWLQKVFWVMGGYIFTTGLLTLYVAITTFRMHTKGAGWIVAVAGLTSIGWMAAINFIIGSDFKVVLLGFSGLWGLALLFYLLEHSNKRTSSSH